MDYANRDRGGGELPRVPLRAVAGSALRAAAAALCSIGIYAATQSWVAAAASIPAAAAAAGFWEARRVRRRVGFVGELADAARDLAGGERLRRIDDAHLGDLAEVAHSLNAIFETLASSTRQALAILDRSEKLPARATEALTQIENSTLAQEEDAADAVSLLTQINASIAESSSRVDNLSRDAEESASAILEMGSSVEEVARNAGSLQEAVEGASASVQEISGSMRQVAESTESVQRIAEETAASMVEVDRTLRQTDEHAKQASELAQKVSEGAEQGGEAVSATIADIERIHEATRGAKAGLEKLVGRLGEIADILKVIGEINDEANLLSLNAAIIAAQAGEQGKAFLVVANHVKLLARRTAASTKDIAGLIQAVQLESDNAMMAMGTGIATIEQGVTRSRRAGEALGAIRESAKESQQRVAEISRAAEEQTRTSALVARAAQETSSQVQQITAAMGEQSRAAEQIAKSTAAALALCRHVYHSTDEQRRSGRYIAESISSITEMVRAIQQNAATHGETSELVSAAVMRLLEKARETGAQIPALNDMLVELSESTKSIERELARFEMLPADLFQ